ncbi:MAG: tRNA (adenosine(37)-N6)-dimethylallyltransferase MiaA [Rhizobiaceae bacterium]
MGDSSEAAGSGRGAGPIKGATLIAGPTASGKSALALELAARTGSRIVNADSMQVYSVLDVLTARPGATELSRAVHLLYGHVHPSTPYSTGAWLREVSALAERGELGRNPVFVGGTGLYFTALLDGLSAMPDIPAAIRAGWRARLAQDGASRLHAILARDDPETAARLQPADGQRIVRALEVLEASGRSIRDWRGARGAALVDEGSAKLILIEPERSGLVARIEDRFERMVEAGALDEVRVLLALGLPSTMPAMKAIGVAELAASIGGRATHAEALAGAKAATRRYAKRQATWFRNQLGPRWRRVPDARSGLDGG